MKRCFHILLLAALSLAGCSQERSRAVNEQSAAGQKDYRQMIQRARTRQNAQNTLAQMQEALQSFQRDMGRLPTNIVELVTRNYIRTIPALSPGQQFAYDPRPRPAHHPERPAPARHALADTPGRPRNDQPPDALAAVLTPPA